MDWTVKVEEQSLYVSDTETEEFKELEEKRVALYEEGPSKLHCLGN